MKGKKAKKLRKMANKLGLNYRKLKREADRNKDFMEQIRSENAYKRL